MSGEFEWNVIALDVNENQICVSENALFIKTANTGSSTSGENGGGNSGDNSCIIGCGSGGNH